MAQLKPVTKKRRSKYRIANAIHLLLQYGPIIVFFIMGLCSASTKAAAAGVSFTMFSIFSVVLAVAAAIRGKMSRSSLWIMLIAFYFVLDWMLPIIITIAACQITDELIARPIRNRLHRKYEHGRDTEDYLAGK